MRVLNSARVGEERRRGGRRRHRERQVFEMRA